MPTWIDEPLDPSLAHGGQLVDPDGEEVARLGRVLPVEVARADDLSALREDDGVVGGAVSQFNRLYKPKNRQKIAQMWPQKDS